jgi:hypothetical protein
MYFSRHTNISLSVINNFLSYLIYKVGIVCSLRLFVRLFAYSSKMDIPICTKLGMLIPWDQEENIGESKLRKSVLSSIPGEGGSCSSETKHDKRAAPRPKFFISNRRLYKKGHNPEKLFRVRLPAKIFFVPRKLGTIERRHDESCLFWRADYRNKGQNTEKLSWVRVLTRQ